MLHRINFPNCRSQLEQILQFQRQVLEMVCDATIGSSITESQIKQRFNNQDVAGWLWKRLWKRGNISNGETNFHKCLIEVIKQLQNNPLIRQNIVDAFNNDTSFEQHLNNPAFQFTFQTLNLDENTLEAIKELMAAFYKDLLEHGFPSCIHQGTEDNFSRESFVAAFWRANTDLGVCPACDGQRPDSVNGVVYCHVDHFFPKATFPFLSVHPANLTPICNQCNSPFKGEKPPIKINNNESLLDTFHPYERPAIEHINVEVNKNPLGKLQVSIVDIQRMPSRRVNNLNEIIQLQKRWTDRLSRQIEFVRDQIANEGKHQLTENKTRDEIEAILMDILNTTRESCENKKSKYPNYVIQSSYLLYALFSDDELDELVSQFLGE